MEVINTGIPFWSCNHCDPWNKQNHKWPSRDTFVISDMLLKCINRIFPHNVSWFSLRGHHNWELVQHGYISSIFWMEKTIQQKYPLEWSNWFIKNKQTNRTKKKQNQKNPTWPTMLHLFTVITEVSLKWFYSTCNQTFQLRSKKAWSLENFSDVCILLMVRLNINL